MDREAKQQAYDKLNVEQDASSLLSKLPHDIFIEIMIWDFTNYQDYYEFRERLHQWAYVSKAFKWIVDEKKEIGFLAELTTPVHLAAAQGEYKKIIEYKLKHDQVNVQDRFGIRPAVYSVIFGNGELFKLFKVAHLDHTYRDEKCLFEHCMINKKYNLMEQLGGGSSLSSEQLDAYFHEFVSALKNNNVQFVRFFLASDYFAFHNIKIAKICQDIIARNHPNEAEETLLFIMQCRTENGIIEGKEDCIPLVKSYNANINVQDHEGYSITAIYARFHDHRNFSLLKKLVEHGADLNRGNKKDGFTALTMASAYGHAPFVEYFLQNGCDINHAGQSGDTALTVAVFNGQENIVQILLKHPDIDLFKETHLGHSAFTLAAMHGCDKCLKHLFAAQPQLTGKNAINELFFLALNHNQPSIVNLLLEEKADINAALFDGITPLMWVMREGLAIAALLLTKPHTNINIAKSDGWNAVMLAAHNNKENNLRLLLEKGAIVNAKNNQGNNALDLAMENVHLSCCQTLIEYKADINQQNNHGWTPLTLAARNKAFDFVKWLIDHKADVTIAASHNYIALHAAASGGCPECVQYLLQHGAQAFLDKPMPHNYLIEGTNENWGLFTPLHIAVHKKHAACIKILAQAGANKNARSSLGVTALEMAKENALLRFMNVPRDAIRYCCMSNEPCSHKKAN